MREPYIGDPLTRLPASSKYNTVPVDSVIPHIEHLRAVGMRRQMIARTAGVTKTTLDNIVQRRYPTVTSAVAQAILAATPTPSKHQALVMGYPTRRRLEGLAVVGWTVEALGERMQRPATNVSHMRLATLVQWRTHCVVRSLYEQISHLDGGNERTKAWAAREGFVHPFDWDDIEDFYESPSTPERLDNNQYRTEEVGFLRGVGLSDTAIAGKLGITLYGLQQWERRYGEVAA